ncbi:uncharacterized protein K460DRAFT_422933 [Cucurbitaria berberidis CBS 394.84]|uniref:SH3 domain-containing protein n=1 Tax=Cucurbitaria berberidis CBS 394.84 TaxID=1168544 RepID=A0A9P4GRG1_9PLEO|nr:uncharacterized protein K460DRAFT_422933 [Cucurbitaria berberidis CBS 394.84]KAF1850457.1 hypothetical protein K460DRAFT_422933 [Cucurbitaria berberidis CBS 394.84]
MKGPVDEKLAVTASDEDITGPSTLVPDIGESIITPILTPATVANLSLNEKDSEEQEKDLSTNNDDQEPEEEFLLIGIDFGTTYSGVAWAYSKQPDDIKIITDWDCIEFQNSDKGKAPTRIAYGQPQPDCLVDISGDSAPTQVTWGYGVEDTEVAEWFKLLLLDEDDLTEEKKHSPQIKKARKCLQKAGKTPVQAVGDYLRLLWNHAISNIEKDFGPVVVEGLQFQVVCTVPAVWTTRAVDRMRQAAKDAGIISDRLAGQTTLRFISEPEAAALATLEDLKARPNFKKGDTFVVCDAGGGTVDLISYKVRETDPMVLAECVEGQGKLCGAVFLDQDFEALMKQLVGDAWNVQRSAIKDMMNAQWENGIKRGFEGQSKDWKIRLPYECIERGAPHIITLNQGHIREIFDNVISQIQELVNDQIDIAVILVGGFGSCRYLFNTLKLENKHRGIDVYQSTGMKPWTSISRGAVLKALTNSSLPGPLVLSRILRCSYGTRFHTQFDPKFHLQQDMFWYELKDIQGDKIPDTKPYSLLPWRESVPTKGGPTTATIAVSIYACDSMTPPSRRDDNVKRSCIIETTLPIDITKLNEHSGANGHTYKEVHYDLEVSVIGVALEFSIMYNGERVGHNQLQDEIKDYVHPERPPSTSDEVLATPRANDSTPVKKKLHAVVVKDYTAHNDTEHSIMMGEWVRVHNNYARKGWAYVEKDGSVRVVPANCIHQL